MKLQNVSNSTLIELLRQGDEKALVTIFDRYWKRLYLMALRRTGIHEVAEEIVQDLFTDLWDKRAQLFTLAALKSNLSAYLLTAVKNKTLNYLRTQVYKKEYCDYYNAVFLRHEETTEKQVEFNQLQDALDKGLQTLPEKSKNVFRLSRLEGRSIPEIATMLNLSEKAIEYHLTKSLKALRFHLKDFILPAFIIAQLMF